MSAFDLRLGDCLDPVTGLASLSPGAGVVITDPVWPNAPDGLFGVSDPVALFAAAGQQLPRLARRVVVWLGVASDPRFLSGVPAALPFVRVCWLRYAVPAFIRTILMGGDVVYVYGSSEGPHGATLLPGEKTSTSARGKEADHPCPRKIEHADWLVKNFTQPGDLVIDPFAGSGTTGVAAIRLGRRFIGWEKDPKYHAIAVKRLMAAREQMELCA